MENYNEIISNTIIFNQIATKIETISRIKIPGINLISNQKDFLDATKLRSKVYHEFGYDEKFPDLIKDHNFSIYDSRSLILVYKRNQNITGTSSIVLGNQTNQFPIKELFETYPNLETILNKILENNSKNTKLTGELSRLAVDLRYRGKSDEFKSILIAKYLFGKALNIGTYFCATDEKAEELFNSYGFETLLHIQSYDSIKNKSVVLKWELDQTTEKFKKEVLKNEE